MSEGWKRGARGGWGILLMAFSSALSAAPAIQNASFEEDRFTAGAGLASGNGGKISGWEYSGNVGLNPLALETGKATAPFWDNGRVPHGKQFAFIQNQGSLKQRVAGFETGKRYQVCFLENARNTGEGQPSLELLAGGVPIVSSHEIAPAAGPGTFDIPFYTVKSAVFSVPKGGALELEFRKPFREKTTVYLDQVSIIEVAAASEVTVEAL